VHCLESDKAFRIGVAVSKQISSHSVRVPTRCRREPLIRVNCG
jgi:hypothetical protein